MPAALRAGLFLVGLAAAAAAQVLFERGSLRPGIACALGAVVFVAIASAVPRRKSEEPRPAPPLGLPLPVEALLVLAVLVLAVGARFVRLEDIPPYLFVDEAHKAKDAAAIAEGADVSPWTVGWWGVPTLYFHYAAVFIRWFGRTELAMRLPCAVSGVLAVCFFYPCARFAFGARWAVLLALLFAGSRWHVNVSRWGGEEVAMPAMWSLALLGLVWALACRPSWLRGDEEAGTGAFAWRWRLVAAGLAGLGLGLVMYTYAAARLLPLGVGAFLIHQVLFRRGFFRRHLAAALLVVAVSALVFSPLALDFIRHPEHLMRRAGETSVFAETRGVLRDAPLRERVTAQLFDRTSPLWGNVGRHLLMFHAAGDRNGRHNLPGEPMLDPITGVLFLVGLGVMLGRIHEPLPGLCLFGALASLAAGILTSSNEAPQAFRTVSVVPVVYLVVGLGLSRGAALLWDLSPRAALQWSGWGAAAAATVAACVWNLALYFGPQMRHHAVLVGFNAEMTVASRDVHALLREDPGRRVYIWPTLFGWATLQFLQPQAFESGRIQSFDASAHLPLTNEQDEDTSLFLDPAQQEERVQIAGYYPEAPWTEGRVPELGRAAYLRGDVPAALQAATRGLQATYTPLTAAAPVERRDPRIAFDWTTADLPEVLRQEGFHATWKGCLVARRTRTLSLLLGAGGAAAPAAGQVLLDDDVVYACTGEVVASTPITLALGLHALEVSTAWRPGDAAQFALLEQEGTRPPAPLAERDLFVFQLPPNGLWATYYAGTNWDGPVLFRRKDRLVEVDQRVAAPFSVMWEGYLKIENAGSYRFEPNSDDGCEIFIDGASVGHDPGPEAGERTVRPVPLAEGFHAVRIRFWDKGGGRGLTIWLHPPGGGRMKLPGGMLYPRPQ